MFLACCLHSLIGHFADSVTRSPLYSIYGETIAGVTVVRAFGAGSKFLRDMLRCADTVKGSFFIVHSYICVDVPFAELQSVLLDVGRWVVRRLVEPLITDSFFHSKPMAFRSIQFTVKCSCWLHSMRRRLVAQHHCRPGRLRACLCLDCHR